MAKNDTPMIAFMGDQVWDQIGDTLSGGEGPIRAAVSYVGKQAPGLLPLQDGDSIVVDGSDGCLKAGVVNPEAIATWMSAGVAVYSLPALHAKIILQGADLAIVGSANASASSAYTLFEACVATTDAGVIQNASLLLDDFRSRSVRLDDVWLKNARKIYRQPKWAKPERPNLDNVLDSSGRSVFLSDTYEFVFSAEAEAFRLEYASPHNLGLYGYTSEPDVEPGDVLIRVWRTKGRRKNDPDGRSRVWAPVEVVSIREDLDDYAWVVVYREAAPDLNRSVTWKRVRDALTAQHVPLNRKLWTEPLTGEAGMAVLALFEKH